MNTVFQHYIYWILTTNFDFSITGSAWILPGNFDENFTQKVYLSITTVYRGLNCAFTFDILWLSVITTKVNDVKLCDHAFIHPVKAFAQDKLLFGHITCDIVTLYLA